MSEVRGDTPARLHRWQALGTVLLIGFGVVGASLWFSAWDRAGDATAATEQLVEVEAVQAALLRAEALASTARAADQPEALAEGTAHDAAVERVLVGITDLAEAHPGAADEIAALNVAVQDHLAATRRGTDADPVGNSGGDLRSEVMPVLERLAADGTADATEDGAVVHLVGVLAIGVGATLALGWVHQRLARTFRRRFNVGVGLAVVVVVVTTAGGTALAIARLDDAARDRTFRAALDQAAARTAANDAFALEGQRLAAEGAAASTAGVERAWQDAAAVVTERGAPAIAPRWAAYAERHEQVVARLDAGDREGAVDLATAEDGSAAAVTAYDEAAAEVVDERVAGVAEDHDAARWRHLGVATAYLLAAGVGAWTFARGIAARRREFA